MRGKRSAKIFQRPRTDCKLAYIDDEQHQQLCRWLLKSGLTYPKIVQLIKKEFKLDVNAMSLSYYYENYISQYLITLRQRNVEIAMKVNRDRQENQAEFVPMTIDNLKRTWWQMSTEPNCDLKSMKIIGELVLRGEDNQIKREILAVKARRIAILEKKAQAAEEAANDTKLDDREFSERIRRIFRRDQTDPQSSNGHAETATQERQHTNGFAS